MLNAVIERFKQPSTYAGVGVLLMAFGVPVSEGLWSAIVQTGVAVASLAAIILQEKPKTPPGE